MAALIPSAGVAFLFFLAVRAMLQADRRERAAAAEIERAARESSATPAPAEDS